MFRISISEKTVTKQMKAREKNKRMLNTLPHNWNGNNNMRRQIAGIKPISYYKLNDIL